MENNKTVSYPAVILAGGSGTRMGGSKGLLEFNGQPWLLEQLRRFEAAGGKRAVVVLGHQHESYFKALPWLSKAENAWFPFEKIDVAVLVNARPERGQFSSVQVAAKFLSALDIAGAFVLPVDVPGSCWQQLADSMVAPIEVCVPEWGGRGGHPVLLSSRFLSLISQIMDLSSEDARLDAQVRKLGDGKVARIQVEDPSISMNINTPVDWQAIS